MRTTWTPERDQVLRAGFEAGEIAPVIAQRIGCTAFAVRARANKLGLRYSEEARQKIMLDCMAVARNHPNRSVALVKSWTPERKERQRHIAKSAGLSAIGTAAQSVEAKRRAIAIASFHLNLKRIGWCPLHLRDEYRLLYRRGFSREEARRIVLEHWRTQLRRALRQIAAVAKPLAEEQRRQYNSLEAQIERVKAGKARVVPTFRPGRVVNDDRSLIGNATGMIAA